MPAIASVLLAIGAPPPCAAQAAQVPPGLPRWSEAADPRSAGDWLVVPVPRTATVFHGPHDDELALSNGLIRRVWRVRPNLATVAFDDQRIGASLLRAVEPEATLTLDGIDLEVGGLVGQPNRAWLSREWIDGLRADPEALALVGVEVGATEPPFRWRRVRHAEQRPWPPPGKRVTFTFRLSEAQARGLDDGAHARTPRLRDDFASLSPEWRAHRTGDAGPGRIRTRSNHAAFFERDLPADTEIVACTIDAGSDRSASWGPGLGLVWPDRVIELCLRPGERRFGVFDGTHERLLGELDPAQPQELRARRHGASLLLEARSEGTAWQRLDSIDLGAASTGPRAVRIGKTDRSGGAGDHADAGPAVECRIVSFEAFGPLDDAARAARDERLLALARVTVTVHYELYDGVPVLAKWLTVHNGAARAVRLDRFTSERLALVEAESRVETSHDWLEPAIDVLSDYMFGGMSPDDTDHVVHWEADPAYVTQVNYRLDAPLTLALRPPVGPDLVLEPGETFTSFRAYEVVHDSTERERNGLALRAAFRTIAPWCTENPIMMHVRNADPASVRTAIDQCAEVGFELVILTFGSGFDIEDDSQENLQRMKELADYAHAKGIELGGYSLLSSRSLGPATDVIDAATGRPGGAKFGSAPCLGSDWGRTYFAKLRAFFEATGFDLLEHDGSYPGDFCASTLHPGHRGHADSQWRQWQTIRDFYRWSRERGVYLNVPDFYFLAGSSKIAMGYRETNWSLPRAWQIVHARQNVFDGTWTKTPSMGWMFVPLTQYHGGGAAATIEPLDEHRDDYEAHLANNFLLGVQACYRGPRLFDGERTRELVRSWVDVFRRHRAILESDVIHLRRADGRDLDFMLHVNPRLQEKGLLAVFNPLDEDVERTLRVPLYYTGLTDTASVRERDGAPRTMSLARDWSIELPVRVPARGRTWFVIE